LTDVDVAVVGAGVVGAATALGLARRGASVSLLEAEPEPGLQASGTNSGILHTGFDSPPGELETRLILRAAELREPVIEALEIPVWRCGAVLNGEVIAGESITDPVHFTRALAAAARECGANIRTGVRVTERLDTLTVNCAGLYADEVARLYGDDSFAIYPRKGEFLVFVGAPLERILLPVPDKRTKGVLVFPTVDGNVVAGPTAVDGDDKDDWSVRPDAAAEILPKARALWPALEGAEPVASYAGLRPAGRGVNYVVGRSKMCEGLVNVAAIRSTGLTASLGIAERVVHALGVTLGPERPLAPAAPEPLERPWWRVVAEYRAR
jgi:glycerol-3-phosphate dehydrogenase